MPLVSPSSPALLEPTLVRRPRRSRAALGWLVGTIGVLGLSVVLYRSHTLLAAARALSLEGRYLSVERALLHGLSTVRDRQGPAASPAASAIGVVGSSDDARRTETGSMPSRAEPPPPAPSAPVAASRPSDGDEERGSSLPSKEPTSKESPPASTKRSSFHAATSGKPVRPATVKKGKAAPEESEDEEAPKSRSMQTVSLDGDEKEKPKALGGWATKAQKDSAPKSDSTKSTKSDSTKSDSKASAEPPAVDSKLNDAIRAASQSTPAK